MVVGTFFGIAFLEIGMKTDLFQFWVLQICWHLESSTLTASSSRIWNSSAGTPSPPLALIIAMLPKAHLTSHSRMFSSRWVTIALRLSRSQRPFLYSFSVYSCHLFLVISVSLSSLLYLSFIVLVFSWNVPMISPVFQKNSLVFPTLLFFSISLHCSLKKAFLCLLAVLWNSALSRVYLPSPLPFTFLLSSTVCEASSDNPGGSDSKNPPAMQETWVQSLGCTDPLEEGMATHSGILAWRIPMDRAAWWARVHGVAKSPTCLSH